MDSNVRAICSDSACIAAAASSIAATLGGISGSAGGSAWAPPQAARERTSAKAGRSGHRFFISIDSYLCMTKIGALAVYSFDWLYVN